MAQPDRTSAAILRMRRAYVRALIEGDSNRAAEALAGGLSLVDPRRLYLSALGPAQALLGEKWLKGEINVAEHHLATQIMVAHLERLRRLMTPHRLLNRRVVMATPSGEHHTLGARMVSDFLYSEGFQVDYLGGNTPTRDLLDFVLLRRPDAVGLSVTLEENLDEAAEAIARMREFPAGPKILAGGRAVEGAAVEAGLLAHAVAANAPEAVLATRKLLNLEETVRTLDVYLRNLGQRVQALRKSRGWNQQRLADAAGLDRSSLSSVENGKHNLTLSVALKLADALSVPLELLIADREAKR